MVNHLPEDKEPQGKAGFPSSDKILLPIALSLGLTANESSSTHFAMVLACMVNIMISCLTSASENIKILCSDEEEIA